MGRPAAFDRDDVLERVTELFWRKGYLGTSVSDVVEATALKPGSIYNAFKSKQGLLLEAIDRYGLNSINRASMAMQQGEVIPALETFFQGLVDFSEQDNDAKGCFLVNTWLELSAHDELAKARIERVFCRVEEIFFESFERARKLGELKSDTNSRALAKYLMMSLWGMRVLSRSRPSRKEFETVVDQVMSVVRCAAN